MQTITVKYLGPTATKPSRLKATASNGAWAIVPRELPEETKTHQGWNRAARVLRDRLGWTGDMIAGATETGTMVYVFTDPTEYRI